MSGNGKIIDGFYCCYDSFDLEDCVLGCTHSTECLCYVEDTCLSLNCKENLGCGMVTEEENNECCKIGAICCRCGLKSPDKLCGQASQFLCLKSVAAFPMDERFLPEPVCAYCCLTCMPECGCCVEAPPCQALEEDPIKKSLKMDRE